MFASRIGSATATISSGASTSRQRSNQGGASSVYGPLGGRSLDDRLEAAATARAVSAESSASLVAGGVLTRPEYTARDEWRVESGSGEQLPAPHSHSQLSTHITLRPPRRRRPSSLA